MNWMKKVSEGNLIEGYCFNHVTIKGTSEKHGKVMFSVLGNWFSEYASGPNLFHVAQVAGEIFGQGRYGLASCERVGGWHTEG